MHAPPGDEMPLKLAVGALDLLEDYPVVLMAAEKSRVAPGFAEGGSFRLQVVPTLAGHLAGPATDTLGRIDQHGFAHDLSSQA
jgi:hypothetical protein